MKYLIRGALSVESLIPSLLPDLGYDLLKEVEIRDQLLPRWSEEAERTISFERQIRELRMISQGVVKIELDSLLSNFFPKLLVRLRVLSSVTDCSRRHCVVHLAQQGPEGNGCSVACVMDHHASNLLLVYPGGCSFDATSIVHQSLILRDVSGPRDSIG
jgi:hypothetical protein